MSSDPTEARRRKRRGPLQAGRRKSVGATSSDPSRLPVVRPSSDCRHFSVVSYPYPAVIEGSRPVLGQAATKNRVRRFIAKHPLSGGPVPSRPRDPVVTRTPPGLLYRATIGPLSRTEDRWHRDAVCRCCYKARTRSPDAFATT